MKRQNRQGSPKHLLKNSYKSDFAAPVQTTGVNEGKKKKSKCHTIGFIWWTMFASVVDAQQYPSAQIKIA